MLQLLNHKFKTDVRTRWNCVYEMLLRFLEQQPAICAALLSPEVRKSGDNIFSLNETDTGHAKTVRALKSMKVASDVMSESYSVNCSSVAGAAAS